MDSIVPPASDNDNRPRGTWRAADLTPEIAAPLWDQFIVKVDHGAPDECWTWLGSADRDGYGRLRYLVPSNTSRRRAVVVAAHRLAWVFASGESLTNGMTIDHLCRVRDCVNPAHLEPVTLEENARRVNDAVRVKCPPWKRSGWQPVPADVDVITEMLANGATCRQVAEHFRVTVPTMLKYRRERPWLDAPFAAHAARKRAHGTMRRYTLGCRCQACRRASSDHALGVIAARRNKPIPSHIEHGTYYCYVGYSCRCEPCKEANRVTCKARAERAS